MGRFNINDFIFYSASIYYHNLYGGMDKFKEEDFEGYNCQWQLKYIKN